uniref:Uncharacterized protein n=1 Tax=Schistocephalus solidus TaxID=70667 RepID=A0A0X3P224_SCHSO
MWEIAEACVWRAAYRVQTFKTLQRGWESGCHPCAAGWVPYNTRKLTSEQSSGTKKAGDSGWSGISSRRKALFVSHKRDTACNRAVNSLDQPLNLHKLFSHRCYKLPHYFTGFSHL